MFLLLVCCLLELYCFTHTLRNPCPPWPHWNTLFAITEISSPHFLCFWFWSKSASPFRIWRCLNCYYSVRLAILSKYHNFTSPFTNCDSAFHYLVSVGLDYYVQSLFPICHFESKISYQHYSGMSDQENNQLLTHPKPCQTASHSI